MMLKWCPCMGWCLAETNGEKVLLNSMTTPAYNVRRISSFGQTVINESGEEEEIARHASVPVTNGKSNPQPTWTSTTVPVQPGVTKSDVTRIQKMASIPEIASPKPRNRLKKSQSDEKNSGEMSPLRARKKIPTPEEFAEVSYHLDNEGETISIISDTNSELSLRSRHTDDEKVKNETPDVHVSKAESSHPTITVEAKIEKKESKSKTSIMGLVKSIKCSDKPKSSEKKTSNDEPQTSLLTPEKNPEKPKTPVVSRRKSETMTPIPKPRNNSIKKLNESSISRRNSSVNEVVMAENSENKQNMPSSVAESTSESKPEVPTPPLRSKKNMEAPEIVINDVDKVDQNTETLKNGELNTIDEQSKQSTREEKTQKEEKNYTDEDEEENLSQTNSISTAQIDDFDEVILDGSKELESSEIARQYGLDLSLYDNDINTNIGLRSSKRDDELSANTSIGKLHFTTHMDKDKNMLLITLEKLEGLGGIGPNNVPFDLIIKLGLIKSNHIYSTKPTLSSEPINQNFSIHVKDLASSILRLSLYNNSWLGNHDALGHALFRVSKCSQSISHHTVNISPKSNITDSAGLIEVSFRLESKVLHIIVHKVFDILPGYRNHKMYIKVSHFISSKKFKEKISKTESAEKGHINFDFESKFKLEIPTDQHSFVMISLKKKTDNNKLFKNDKTIGRIYLGPLYYTGNKVNLWGQAILEEKIITHNFTFYL